VGFGSLGQLHQLDGRAIGADGVDHFRSRSGTQSLQLNFFGLSASASGDAAVLYLTIIALVLVVGTVLARVLRRRE
jgi:uncharacterized membrane protein YtjA (UPF0391 family)